MNRKIVPFMSRAEQAWEKFVVARARAETTLKFEDGHRAGLAFREFVDLYLVDDTSSASPNRPH